MSTFDRLRQILARVFGVSEELISPHTTMGDLYSRGTWSDVDGVGDSVDSLGKVELIMRLEEAFDIAIPDSIADAVYTTLQEMNATVQQIVDLIDRAC